MADSPLTPAKRRVLEMIKRLGPTEAAELAARLRLTQVGVRQHLAALEKRDLVRSTPQPARGRGRPSAVWSLTDLADGIFPDRHADLTVSLIEATRAAVGESGLRRIVDARADVQLRQYRESLPPGSASLGKRIDALARQRSAEGYMAEVRREGRGVFILIEHHCPICEAAKSCQGLCVAELRVFSEYLGPGVEIERVDHLLGDGDRCAYRITAA